MLNITENPLKRILGIFLVKLKYFVRLLIVNYNGRIGTFRLAWSSYTSDKGQEREEKVKMCGKGREVEKENERKRKRELVSE